MYIKTFNRFNARVYLNRKESGVMVDELYQAVDIQFGVTDSAIQATMPPFSIIVGKDCLPYTDHLSGVLITCPWLSFSQRPGKYRQMSSNPRWRCQMT